ncbi:MAG: Ig-like domain repeat protein [Terriglobales bacterium]
MTGSGGNGASAWSVCGGSSVSAWNGGTTLGTGTISGGIATYSTSTLPVGSNSITAAYGGDANDNSSTSSALTQTVNKATPTVTLTSSANPSTYGSSVTFTATLSISTATGTVTFKNGSTTLGTGTVSSGKATFSISTLAVGSNSITAAYGGDANDNSSTSSVLTQTVKANTAVTLASSANPSTHGLSVTFTATVSPSTATGTVTFKNGSTTLGTGTISSGTATYSTSTLAVGSNSITASYGGDAYDNSSTSSALTQTVNKANTTVNLASSANPSVYGSSVTFTATVTPSTATGTVTFADGGTTLGTGTISGGIATYSTSTLAVGSNSITASYGGDANDSGSTSATLTQTVQNSVTLTSISVTPQNAALPIGATQQFTATGTYSNGTQGNVTSTATWTTSDGTIATITAAGIATGVAEGPVTITAAVGAINGSATITGSPSPFRFTGSLNTERIYNTATVLQNGQVLIVGGYGIGANGTDDIAVCELFNPATGIFTPTGSLNFPRYWHTATLLQNGMVLITGGVSWNTADGYDVDQPVAELYDPATGLFSPTGSLNFPRVDHTATLLQNGQVLVAGGGGSSGPAATAEVYKPATGIFTNMGNLNNPRSSHTATLLNDGTVLIAGGGNGNPGLIAAAEIYNPTAGTFTPTGSLNNPRYWHTATLLARIIREKWSDRRFLV